MPEQLVKLHDVETGAEQTVDLYNNTIQFRDVGTGRLVKLDLGQGDVHIDRALANFATGVKLQDGVADEAMPVVMTESASNKYWQWDKDDALQEPEAMNTSAGAAVKEISPRLSSTSYATAQYALGAFIPTEVEANADSPLKIKQQHLRRIINAMNVARERRVASALRLATNYGTAFKATIAAGSQWNGGASSNPVQDIYNRMEAALVPPTDMVMSDQVWHDFVQNSSVQKFTGYKDGAPPLARQDQATSYAALLNLPRPHIVPMKFKSSTTAYSYVWGADVVLLRRAPQTTDGSDIATGYTFRWSGGQSGDQTLTGGYTVRTFFNPVRGPRGGTQIVATVNDAEQFVADFCSGLIISAHQ